VKRALSDSDEMMTVKQQLQIPLSTINVDNDQFTLDRWRVDIWRW